MYLFFIVYSVELKAAGKSELDLQCLEIVDIENDKSLVLLFNAVNDEENEKKLNDFERVMNTSVTG